MKLLIVICCALSAGEELWGILVKFKIFGLNIIKNYFFTLKFYYFMMKIKILYEKIFF